MSNKEEKKESEPKKSAPAVSSKQKGDAWAEKRGWTGKQAYHHAMVMAFRGWDPTTLITESEYEAAYAEAANARHG